MIVLKYEINRKELSCLSFFWDSYDSFDFLNGRIILQGDPL